MSLLCVTVFDRVLSSDVVKVGVQLRFSLCNSISSHSFSSCCLFFCSMVFLCSSLKTTLCQTQISFKKVGVTSFTVLSIYLNLTSQYNARNSISFSNLGSELESAFITTFSFLSVLHTIHFKKSVSVFKEIIGEIFAFAMIE